jgi:hypothetical protein
MTARASSVVPQRITRDRRADRASAETACSSPYASLSFVCQIRSHRNCQRVAADGCTCVALWLENDLDGAVLSEGCCRRGVRQRVRREGVNAQRVVVYQQRRDVVDPFLHVGMTHSQLDLLPYTPMSEMVPPRRGRCRWPSRGFRGGQFRPCRIIGLAAASGSISVTC